MPSDQQDILQGLRLAAVGLVSALVTATIVIGAGQVWLSRGDAAPTTSDQSTSDQPTSDQPASGQPSSDGRLIRTAG